MKPGLTRREHRLRSRGALQRLEPDDGKLSRPVLRGGSGGNAALLPDQRKCRLCSTTRMNTTVSPASGQQLWGIYYTDREHARELGDPLRTVVDALTKQAAEEAAGKLGVDSPWAHPVTGEQARHALWFPKRKRHQRQLPARKHSRGIHV
jgi:hypothetical protein